MPTRTTPTSYIIPATGGHFYKHGEGIMGVSTDRSGPIAKKLMMLPCILTGQIGDDGVNLQFRVEDFPIVAKVIRPRVKRTLKPEHKAKLLAAGAKHRFSSGSKERWRERQTSANRSGDCLVAAARPFAKYPTSTVQGAKCNHPNIYLSSLPFTP